MEKLATDIYTFEDLRKDGYTYVDKTAMMLPLADESIGKQVTLIGAAFDAEMRNLTDRAIKEAEG